MANNLTVNPLFVDTAFTTGIAEPVLIKKMVYTGADTIGDQVKVTGSVAGNVIWWCTLDITDAAGAGYREIDFTGFPGGGFLTDGLEVALIESGLLLIYV